MARKTDKRQNPVASQIRRGRMKQGRVRKAEVKVVRSPRVVGRGEDIPAEDMKKLFLDLLDHLQIEVVVEETPDYVSYSLRQKFEDPF